MQQRSGPDVVVQQSRHAAQLGQSQPDPHEQGLVAQEQRHRVPRLQLRVRRQSPGHLVALCVCLFISVGDILENEQLLVWMLRYSVQKTVQNAVKAPLYLPQTVTHVKRLDCVIYVRQQIGVPQVKKCGPKCYNGAQDVRNHCKQAKWVNPAAMRQDPEHRRQLNLCWFRLFGLCSAFSLLHGNH